LEKWSGNRTFSKSSGTGGFLEEGREGAAAPLATSIKA
jgi:hypothetical protein